MIFIKNQKIQYFIINNYPKNICLPSSLMIYKSIHKQNRGNFSRNEREECRSRLLYNCILELSQQTNFEIMKLQKYFFNKKLSKIKVIKNNNVTNKVDNSSENLDKTYEGDVYIKPKMSIDKKNDKTNLESLMKMDDKSVVQYYNDLKNLIIDFGRGPNFKIFYFLFHISTCYGVINNFIQFYWIYQVFFGTSMLGLSYLNYEFYSTIKEKKIIDRFILACFTLLAISFAVGIYAKFNTDIKGLNNSLFAYLFVNLVYSLMSFNYRLKLFIPSWILKYLPIYTILMSGVLTYGYLQKRIEIENNDDSRLFSDLEIRSDINYFSNVQQAITLKNNYANELTRIINQLSSEYLDSVNKNKNLFSSDDVSDSFDILENKKF